MQDRFRMATLLALTAGVTGRTFAESASIPSASPTSWANVRDYGAVGDDKTDDTGAIQKAVDSKKGGVWLPKGRYRITKPVTIELDRLGPTSICGDGTATIVMAGPGPALHLIGTHEGTADPSTVKPNVWRNQRMPLIDGFEIMGDHAEAVGVRAERTMQAVFSRLVIRKALHGIHLVTRNRNAIISECHVYENRGVGVFMDGCDLHQINICNSHISYNGGGGVVLRKTSVRNLQIGTCDIEGNMDPNGPPTANVLIDSSTGQGLGNWDIREGAIVGCTIQHTGGAPDSANIRFIGRDGTPPLTVGRFTISDNVMSDVQVNIHLKNARGVTITGNTLWRAVQHSLLIENSSHIVVSANLLERNPAYRDFTTGSGVVLRDCQDCTLTGLHIHDTRQAGAGLVLERCKWCNITDNIVVDCDNAGVLMEDVEHVRMSDCIVRDTRKKAVDPIALRLTGGKGNMIVNNLLAGKAEVAPGTAHLAGNYDGR
ncbi:MAG: right-handed parallel beta-helix repeat-containing protein [Phycisphaerae bacterium]|nr:right-handed parallel beta-helix repeat-containing protein [Phycisphaerae bacterium]